ncbi:MAG TPA: rod shape-determining protein MreC, partial [Gammaproteobacteria bacterium]|nr:rod shape-determining protein MreC [Gammaproteobacteria bacterium]
MATLMTYGIGRSRTRFVVLALLSLVLMGLDTYTDSLKKMRPIVGLIVVPVHLVAMIPALILTQANALPFDVARLQQDYQALKENRLLLNSRLQRFEAIEAENDRLRSLLSATGYTPDEVLLAEVVQVNVDPYSRTLLINRGTVEGVYEGQAVLDANGLLGQVVRSGVFRSTVALITDSSQAIPVMSVRSGLHVLAYGTG